MNLKDMCSALATKWIFKYANTKNALESPY